MGKADMTRDYYGDLELQPSADLADIKKQFKKLALKWHPDRNPGREAEVNAKFQTIQSAHEILSDELERRKYDLGRLRTSSRYTASTAGTRGNPYANAGSQWAPPPKPFGTPRAAAASQGPSGAERYQKFGASASSRSAPNRSADQETKKNNYEAFERMRTNPTGTFARTGPTPQHAPRWTPSGSPKAPDPRYTPQSGREESNNQKHAPPPKPSKPGYAEWNAGEMHGRQSPRKSGFMPGNPDGDEPPAPTFSSAYYNARSGRAPSARNYTAPEPPPRPNVAQKFRDSNLPVDGGTRQSAPYATHGGEKTNPFETSNIHRSKTTRERSNANGYSTAWESRKADSSSSGSTRDKHRSASPPRSRNFREQPSTFETSVGSPPKRNHSHINTSPPASGPDNKARGAPRSHPRFQPSAVSDTSSEDEDSDVQEVINNHLSSKKLPRRKAPAHSVPKSNVTNDQYRKPNLAEFRKLFKSGDPLLNKLCSESAGDQKGSNATSQPMYEQNSHHPIFHNISSPQSLPNVQKKQTAQDGINEPKQTRFAPNDRSSTAENLSSSPWHTDSTSSPSSPMSRADDLSNFEQCIMGDLHRTFAAANTQDTFSSHNAARNTGRERSHNINFGQPIPLGPGTPDSSSVNTFPRNDGSGNLAAQAASSISRSPKRKIEVCDSDVDSRTGAPRKIAAFYDGLKASQSNSTNPINNRFPAAYKSQPPTIPPLFTANNTESINTTFETEKWDGQFRAASFVNPTEFNNGASRPQVASRNGRRSPIKSRSNGRTRSASASVHSDTQSATFEQPQPPNLPMESPVSKPFTPEEWSAAEMFKPSTFAPPAPRGSSRPPPFSRTPSRKGSRAKVPHANKTAGGRAAVVEDYSSDSDVPTFNQPWSSANGSTTTAQPGPTSPNAMDIDPPDEFNGETSRPGGEARNVPIEPMRPEWRSGATNGNAHSSRHNLDDHDFKANFDDLKNVEPLFQPAHGLSSVNDLKSSLPFVSTASETIPLKSEATSSINLKIPNPPLAPMVPSKPVDGTQRMSPASWQSYLLAFKAYLTDYQLYNEQIEAHFKARQDAFNSLRERQGWAWLESKSDDLFEAQMTEVRQDRLVREKWAEAGKGHEAAMEQFGMVRGAMSGKKDM